MRSFLVIYLPIYFVLFFGLAFLWRTWMVWQTTGINPYKLKDREGPEQIIGAYFRLLPFLSLTAMIVYVLLADHYRFLSPLIFLENAYSRIAGIVLMSAALVWILLAQSQMGTSWRIGIDHDTATEFIQTGPFKFSRNPIFLGIVISAIGYFLALPNALTLVILVLDIALIQIQVSLEETYLMSTHGERYQRYCEQVRRWI